MKKINWPQNILIFAMTVCSALMLLFCIALPVALILIISAVVVKPAIWFYDKCRAEARKIYG